MGAYDSTVFARNPIEDDITDLKRFVPERGHFERPKAKLNAQPYHENFADFTKKRTQFGMDGTRLMCRLLRLQWGYDSRNHSCGPIAVQLLHHRRRSFA